MWETEGVEIGGRHPAGGIVFESKTQGSEKPYKKVFIFVYFIVIVFVFFPNRKYHTNTIQIHTCITTLI